MQKQRCRDVAAGGLRRVVAIWHHGARTALGAKCEGSYGGQPPVVKSLGRWPMILGDVMNSGVDMPLSVSDMG